MALDKIDSQKVFDNFGDVDGYLQAEHVSIVYGHENLDLVQKMHEAGQGVSKGKTKNSGKRFSSKGSINRNDGDEELAAILSDSELND